MDKAAFLESCDLIIGNEQKRESIGVLREKTLHAVLKNYFEPLECNQEVKIGSFVADIVNQDGIIEIQTGSFSPLNRKLSDFLPAARVTVVCPVPENKWLVWIDPDTGERSKPHKSPKAGSIYCLFRELWKIKPFLTHENFNLCIVLVDVTEYRLLNGWNKTRKRGSTRYERIPSDLKDEVYFTCPEDYKLMIPDSLDEFFTVSDYKAVTKISQRDAGSALNLLVYLGVAKRIGKRGRAYLYSRV